MEKGGGLVLGEGGVSPGVSPGVSRVTHQEKGSESEKERELVSRLAVISKERDFFKEEYGNAALVNSSVSNGLDNYYQTPSRSPKPYSPPNLSTIRRRNDDTVHSVQMSARKHYEGAHEASRNHVKIVEGILKEHFHSPPQERSNGHRHRKMSTKVRVTHSMKISASIVARVYLKNKADKNMQMAAALMKWRAAGWAPNAPHTANLSLL